MGRSEKQRFLQTLDGFSAGWASQKVVWNLILTDHSLANSQQNAQSPCMVRFAANAPCQPAFGGGGRWSRRPSAFCPGQDLDVLTSGESALRLFTTGTTGRANSSSPLSLTFPLGYHFLHFNLFPPTRLKMSGKVGGWVSQLVNRPLECSSTSSSWKPNPLRAGRSLRDYLVLSHLTNEETDAPRVPVTCSQSLEPVLLRQDFPRYAPAPPEVGDSASVCLWRA